MSIKTEIDRIKQSKADIILALKAKGVIVPTDASIDDLSALVEAIELSEDLSSELTTQETLLNNQISKINNAINALKGKAAGGGEILLQEKTISPLITTQTVTADSDYDGLSKVNINAVTSSIDSNITSSNIKSGVSILGVTGTLEEGITPSGTLEITENGTYDVTNYASANVNVASIGGDDGSQLADFLGNNLATLDNSLATSLMSRACQGATKLVTVNLPSVTSIGTYAFYNCTGMTTVHLPLATSIPSQSFYNCNKLKHADFGRAGSIAAQAFNACTSLTELILRKTDSICTLSNTNGVNNTGIGKGNGYFYVPRSLIDTYKTATNWSTFAERFRALEDYTIDGTITGELDPNKI